MNDKIKAAGFMTFAFIGGATISAALVGALGVSDPIIHWITGVFTGFAIICAGSLK